MGSNTLMVSDYLRSLKEDTELDYLFPILLNLMGFRIVTTPKESKGQPQYGKDIIAIGKDYDGTRKRFYFELKGHADRDIDDTVLMKRDGIMESLRAAKYTVFKDSSISDFNALPVKFVLVHNGVLKNNTRPTFEGFIAQEFPDSNFERWDIYRLTDLFSQYLFGEYLLTDEESVRHFKRTLVLLDAPDYDFSDFKQLVQLQQKKITGIKGRSFTKFFATLNLLGVIVVHYSRENNNLEPAKQCLNYVILKTWHWILANGLAEKKAVITEFRKLLTIHFELLQEYFVKTLPYACEYEGLFAERGGPFETIGYPLRSFDYLNSLIYYFEARAYWPGFDGTTQQKKQNLRNRQKEIIKKLIRGNIGCRRPVIDSNSIAILNVFLFFFRDEVLTDDDKEFIHDYLLQLFDNILIIYQQHQRFPELSGNISALSEFIITGKRPAEYEDRSSLLLTILFELTTVLDNEEIYSLFRQGVDGKINLQTAFSSLPDEEFEKALFEKNLNQVYYVETSISLPEDFKAFRTAVSEKKLAARHYKTDAAGFHFLRILAHVYYQNEWLPDEWRAFL
ncbi:hypothetical protein [Flaviaesturariibacter aridisoli]|uniref:Uncharacterized protein n=1 Tax=Flaviaesturariibacter aridisoli TaxID=2545761 RepID=A0A4R4DUG3_9BACT|nr:hypothetical protein [Flaviaesturariibacter aridisoli]TCZ64636.1 hypothetical protein E0486_18105 [Flaviaesturariibacter aridisoli]